MKGGEINVATKVGSTAQVGGVAFDMNMAITIAVVVPIAFALLAFACVCLVLKRSKWKPLNSENGSTVPARRQNCKLSPLYYLTVTYHNCKL